MAISDFVLPTEDVALPGGNSFAVRGLSLQDITLLLSKNGPTMESFFGRYSGKQDLQMGLDLIAEAPALVAQIIALAADDHDKVEMIKKFPLTVQQDALEKIAKLTFDASGGPGKFVEAVIRLVQGATSLTSKLPR